MPSEELGRSRLPCSKTIIFRETVSVISTIRVVLYLALLSDTVVEIGGIYGPYAIIMFAQNASISTGKALKLLKMVKIHDRTPK